MLSIWFVFLAGFFFTYGMDKPSAFEIVDFGERCQPKSLLHSAQKASLVHLFQNKKLLVSQIEETFENLPLDIKTQLASYAQRSDEADYRMPAWLKLVKNQTAIAIGQKLFGLIEGFESLSREEQLKHMHSWYVYWLENPGFEGLFQGKGSFFNQDEDGGLPRSEDILIESKLIPFTLHIAAAHKRYESFFFLLNRYKFVLGALLNKPDNSFREHFEQLIKTGFECSINARTLLKRNSILLPTISRAPFLVFFRNDKSVCHTKLKEFFEELASGISHKNLSDLVRHTKNMFDRNNKNGRRRKKGSHFPRDKYHASPYRDVKIIDGLKTGNPMRFEWFMRSMSKGKTWPSELLIRYLASEGSAADLKRIIEAYVGAHQDLGKCITTPQLVNVAFAYVKNRPFAHNIAAFLIAQGASIDGIQLDGMRYGCSIFQKAALEEPHFLEYALMQALKCKREMPCIQFLIDHARKFEFNFREPDFLNNLGLLNVVVIGDDDYSQEVAALLLKNKIQPMKDANNKYPFEVATSDRMRNVLIENNGVAPDDDYFRGWLYDQIETEDVSKIRSMVELLSKEQLKSEGIFAECRRQVLLQALKLKNGQQIIEDMHYKCGVGSTVIFNGKPINWLLFTMKMQLAMKDNQLYHIPFLINLLNRHLGATDENGNTALQLAETGSMQDVVALLKEKMAPTRSTNGLHS